MEAGTAYEGLIALLAVLFFLLLVIITGTRK